MSEDDCPKCGAHRYSGGWCPPEKQPCPFDHKTSFTPETVTIPLEQYEQDMDVLAKLRQENERLRAALEEASINLPDCPNHALHRILEALSQSANPALEGTEKADTQINETTLRDLMRSPRYWRDRDPELVAKVRDGFRRLYPD